MDQEKIGVFISTLRKEQGMTQQQLADAIGVSNKTISKGTLLFTGLSISISIALNGILYGLIGFLLLLPIQVRLEIMYMQKQEDSEKKTEDDAE